MADKIGTDEYGEILIYQTDDGQTNIEVKIEDDTVWLTQQQMSELFQTSRTNVRRQRQCSDAGTGKAGGKDTHCQQHPLRQTGCHS